MKKDNFKKRDFKKKNFFKGNDNFRPKDRANSFEKFISKSAEKKDINEINQDFFDKDVEVSGLVERIAQTGGPTIFVISDGTGTLALKGFIGQGQRAYPEINEGDTIRATVTINEYNKELEGEIKKVAKLDEKEHEEYLDRIIGLQKKRAEIKEIPFLVKSPILEKLKPLLIKAASEIRLAIIQSRPIIVRHHNDTDGYCSGYALEKAIIPLIEKEHGSEKASYEFFLRAPSQAPFYEIDDSIRDTATSLRNVAKFSNKMPLIIITDNGSTPEDLFAIKQGKIHGAEFIVVDHHFFDEDVISKEVLTHISPFLVGEDGARFSAGMLCAELARLINNLPGLEILPAIAGLADRIDINNPEVIEEYIKIAKKEGYTKELLINISKVIDFVSAKIRFMEVREYIGVIFGEPRNKQKELVGLMAPYIIQLEQKGLQIAKTSSKTEKIGKTTLQLMDIENTFPGFGFYPKPGKCVGMLHDDIQTSKGIDNLVTAGLMNTAITLRATDKSNFSMHELITYLNKKSPNSFVAGGGHKNAGSITFLPNKQQEILELLKIFIKDRQ
ncbi:MAG: OB-fold nucleic acid binding domain-containing protein [Candidatus Pacearchaeota archaeon]|jgi:RecJ-like exonuclease